MKKRLAIFIMFLLFTGCASQRVLKAGDEVFLEPNTVATSSDALYDMNKIMNSGRMIEDIRREFHEMELQGRAFYVTKGTKARIVTTDGLEFRVTVLGGPNKGRECVVTQSMFMKS
jgi:hypothetical protein